MTPHPLPLRPRPRAAPLPVTAGWLPSAEVKDWLREARRILEACPGAEIRFFPVAASPRDLAAAGAVITVTTGGGESVLGLEKHFSPRVMPLGSPAPRVLVPADARLSPAWTPREERAIFPWALQFFHPALGMTGFEETDGLRPEELLTAPAAARGLWLAALPGPVAPPPLRGVTLERGGNGEDLLSAAEAGDIGSAAGTPTGLSGAVRDLADNAGKAAAGLLGAAAGGALRALGGGSVADKIERWSRKQWEDVASLRKKELQRLLRRFDKDPLDALRHAIPLAGAEMRRGPAPPPDWRLGGRSLDFQPARSATGPVDRWDIDRDTRLALERRYRDAAAREAAAGNFERAAYIYGELLADWNQTALMLEQAGRTRDAAWILQKRLNSVPRAAACLEAGGFVEEAAALYQQAGMSEKAGDMMARMGRDAEARTLWREAACRMAHPVELAKLLETKLDAPDEALAALRKGWPGTPHAQACFREEFALLGKLDRNAEAAALLDMLGATPAKRLTPASGMVRGLLSVFREFPDAPVRARSAELALTLAGAHLAAEPRGPAAADLARLISQFAPDDLLLTRDGERFALTLNRPAPPKRTRAGDTARPSHVIPLAERHHWQSLASHGKVLTVAGWTESPALKKRVVSLCRVSGGRIQSQTNESWPELIGDIPPRINHLMSGERGLMPVILARTESLAGWRALGRASSSPSTLALGPGGRTDEFFLLRMTETGTLTVDAHGGDGSLRRSRVLDTAPPAMARCECWIGGHGDDLWIAGPDVACCVTPAGVFQAAQLAAPPSALAVAPPSLSSLAMVIAGKEAILLLPRGPKGLECVNLFTSGTPHPPVTVFTADGRAVVAGAGGGLIYGVRGGLEKQGDVHIPADAGAPVAAAAVGTGGFAFLTSAGRVLLYDCDA